MKQMCSVGKGQACDRVRLCHPVAFCIQGLRIGVV